MLLFPFSAAFSSRAYINKVIGSFYTNENSNFRGSAERFLSFLTLLIFAQHT